MDHRIPLEIILMEEMADQVEVALTIIFLAILLVRLELQDKVTTVEL